MLDILVGLGAIAAIIAILPALGFDIRIFGWKKDMNPSAPVPKWRWWLVMVIACLSLLGTGFNLYKNFVGGAPIKSDKLTQGAILGYGNYPNLGPGYVHIRADEDALSKYREQYKMVGVAFHYWGTGDLNDAPLQSKSEPYDIETGTKIIIIKGSPEYVEEVNKGYARTNYVLLVVPKGVNVSQFSTLRQAYGLNVLSVGGATGPP